MKKNLYFRFTGFFGSASFDENFHKTPTLATPYKTRINYLFTLNLTHY